MIDDLLYAFLHKSNSLSLYDQYSAGELIGTEVAVRSHPYISGARFEISPGYYDALYVQNRLYVEGDDVPDDAINKDPKRLWFYVLIFPKKDKTSDYGSPHPGYIAAEYIYLIAGNQNPPYITSDDVYLRYTPGKSKGPKAELKEETYVTEIYRDDTGQWSYCSTPHGLGWINNAFLILY